MSGDYTILEGDCLEVLRSVPAETIDAIVTDPPYGLAFMGQAWDSDVPSFEVWREAYRVVKPGAHVIAFGGTRTYHILATAIEKAGFIIRDMGAWLYGTGFPKSVNVSKAIDKAAGAVRAKVRVLNARNPKVSGGGRDGIPGKTRSFIEVAMRVGYHEIDDDTPITPEAQRWDGWGTGLKPAHEPFVIARKPLRGTVADNVLRYGTGAINVAAGTIPSPTHTGRWPTNVIHDGSDDVLALFPDTNGSAARYFYCAKASMADRDHGLHDVRRDASTIADGCETAPRRNHHPTVKPTELMRYLVRIFSIPGAVILDPFCGSGSTGRAAAYEGRRFLGIEINSEYCDIARKRIAVVVGAVAHPGAATAEMWPEAQPALFYAPQVVAPQLRPKPKPQPRAMRDAQQMSLFETEDP